MDLLFHDACYPGMYQHVLWRWTRRGINSQAEFQVSNGATRIIPKYLRLLNKVLHVISPLHSWFVIESGWLNCDDEYLVRLIKPKSTTYFTRRDVHHQLDGR